VSQDQFLVLLDRREAAMRRRLEQIISELGQLRDLLVLTSKNNKSPQETAQETSQEDSSVQPAERAQADEQESKESKEQAKARILLLRSQQAAAQVAKSEGELKGVLSEISLLVAELINNRIDSKDRRDRLGDKIKTPLSDLIETKWKPFAQDIEGFETSLAKWSPEEFAGKIDSAIVQNNEMIVALNAILSDMIEIQDLNEIIDRVRGLLDQQSKILDRSKEQQKKSTLDLLK
jgi:hypothetical protein